MTSLRSSGATIRARYLSVGDVATTICKSADFVVKGRYMGTCVDNGHY